MSQLPVIQERLLGDAIFARLQTLTGVSVYRGETPQDEAVPLIEGDDGPDPARRVAPFIVHFDGAGVPVLPGQADVADRHNDLGQIHMFHCVAGYETDCTHLVGRLRALLFRWTPTATGELAGMAFGRMRPPPGYDPGPVRLNDSVTPPRFWLPQQYRLDTTT